MSRIGKKPVVIPEGVTASVVGQKINVNGPKGAREFTATDDVTIKLLDGEVLISLVEIQSVHDNNGE